MFTLPGTCCPTWKSWACRVAFFINHRKFVAILCLNTFGFLPSLFPSFLSDTFNYILLVRLMIIHIYEALFFILCFSVLNLFKVHNIYCSTFKMKDYFNYQLRSAFGPFSVFSMLVISLSFFLALSSALPLLSPPHILAFCVPGRSGTLHVGQVALRFMTLCLNFLNAGIIRSVSLRLLNEHILVTAPDLSFSL